MKNQVARKRFAAYALTAALGVVENGVVQLEVALRAAKPFASDEGLITGLLEWCKQTGTLTPEAVNLIMLELLQSDETLQ